MEAGRETRSPRGALVVIAIGLIGCVAAALLSTDKQLTAAQLTWDEMAPLPDSKPVAIPGGGTMRIEQAGLRATAPNAGGYSLYRVTSVLMISTGAHVGQGRVRCITRVPMRTIVAHTTKQRASYPQPSPDLIRQGGVPRTLLVEFSAQNSDLAVIEFEDAFDRFTGKTDITVEWTPYRPGQQGWDWGLPTGRPGKPLTLGFGSIWRTTATPAARIACTVETEAGTATTRTAGSL
jgi:hypothetical protein